MRDLSDSAERTDDQTMRLAHPQRCAVCLEGRGVAQWGPLIGSATLKELTSRFKSQTGLTGDILVEMAEHPQHERLAVFTRALASGAANTEMGSAFSVMVFARQEVSPQPQFLIDDRLIELLEQTDISDDVPVSALTLPYPRCYIELGTRRDLNHFVPNPETGLHRLEGAYLETGNSPRRGPGVFVMFTGSPLGREHSLDDATNSLFLSTADPETPLRLALRHMRDTAHREALELGLTPDLQERSHEFEALKLIIKALLYLNLPEARKSLRPELTQARDSVQGKKNPSKRAKAEKALSRLRDYILVSAPETAGRPSDLSADTRGIKAHWRRGHYRMQAHGPQYSLRKVVLIAPVLVGSLEEANSAPRYKAKA